MAPSFVQAKSAGAATSAASVAATFTSAVTAANLLFAVVTHGAGGGTATCSSITDTGGNTWAKIGSDYYDASNGQKASVWYAKNVTGGGSFTVTANLSASVPFREIQMAEYSGLDTTAPLDQSNVPASYTSTATGTDGCASASITPTVDGCLIVGAFCDTSGANTVAPGTGYTERIDDALSGGQMEIEDKVQATAAAVQATWTVGTAGHGFMGAVVSFKPPAAATYTPRMALLGVG